MRTTVRYKGFHCDWVVLRGGVSSRPSVLRLVLYHVVLLLVSSRSSRLASRLVSSRPVVSLRRGVGRNGLCGASSPSSYLYRPRSCVALALVLVSSHPVPSFETCGGAVVACHSISSGVLCRLVISVRHGRWLSRVVSILGNRADKNGAFCLSCRLRLIQLALVLRGSVGVIHIGRGICDER